MTFETLDQSDEETGPDQKTDNDKDKHKDKDNEKYIYRAMTMKKTHTLRAPSKSNPSDL